MTVIDKLKEVSAFLESEGIEDAAKEAEILVTEILQINKSKLYTDGFEISEDTSRQIDAFASRRASGEPLQYILGYVEFCGLKINVGSGVLIPRPETELLVEEAIKLINGNVILPRPPLEKGGREDLTCSPFTILDLCTGSGCIALALAKHFPEADVYGVDASEAAMVYASQNAIENNIKNVYFRLGNLFDAIKGMRFDYIVSNPPYIKRDEIQSLQREIKDYEPVEALDGGRDGLDFYRRIFKDAPEYLKDNGLIIFEIGFDQSDDVRAIAVDAGFKDIIFIKDYAGFSRIFLGKFDKM